MVTGPLFEMKTTFTKYCLTQWISKLPRSFEIHWVRPYLVNFTSLDGTENTTVYKTRPIFTGLEHGNLSSFLMLRLHMTNLRSIIWVVWLEMYENCSNHWGPANVGNLVDHKQKLTCSLPEWTESNPWGQLRDRIFSIEKKWRWKFTLPHFVFEYAHF